MLMKAYFIKIALRGVSPMVWRRLRISDKTSLAHLHTIIQIAYCWDDEHLHQFHIYGKNYGISYVGGLWFSDDAYKVFIDNFDFDVGDKFTYEYNFFIHCLVDIRIEDIKESTETVTYCLSGNGVSGVSESDVTERTVDFMHALAKCIQSDTKTIDLKKLRPYAEALDAVKFNRNSLNQSLKPV